MQKLALSCCWVALLAGCKHDAVVKPEPRPTPAPVETRAPAASPAPPPTRFETIRALLRSSDLPLEKAAHCENVIGEHVGKQSTLGDWVAYNLSVLEKGTLELPASCSREKDGYRCKVEFSMRNDAENVLWRWGVAFRLTDGRDLDRSSVTCIGAG